MYKWSEPQQMIKDMVRDFVEKEIVPQNRNLHIFTLDICNHMLSNNPFDFTDAIFQRVHEPQYGLTTLVVLDEHLHSKSFLLSFAKHGSPW